MCGINGFTWKNDSLINSMNSTINHRGPDDNGTILSEDVSLGHVRLSIIDLSKKGHQPFKYKHLTITYNGEIYNFKNIKEELINKGYKFESETDTEVVCASFLEWGNRCVEKFNGMWAFCIYDSKKKKLFLSRDRFGKKPLYYYLKNRKLIFSSEIKGILEHKIVKTINKKSLNEIFTYRFTFSDNTIFENIYNFKPGHNMIFDLKSKKIEDYRKYYFLKINKSTDSFKIAKKKIFKLMDGSVKSRMVSDVPVATFLSGGIDSSIVTYFAKKYNPNLNTFSVGFDTTNELSFAKIVAKHLKTNHREFIIDKHSVLKYIDEMVYHMDEPIGADPGFLPIFVLSKETSKYNKVVLTGDGADEIFSGYDRYKLVHYGNFLKKVVPRMNSKNEIVKRLIAQKGKSVLDSFFEVTRVFERGELKRMKLHEARPDFKFIEKLNTSNLNKIQIFDIENLLLKDFFMKSDKMSSAFGLEQRTPFMDFKIVEYGLSLPIRFRLWIWNEKNILKKLSYSILPRAIWKRRKHGFNVPIDYWFCNELGDKLRELLRDRKHELYNSSYVLELLDSLKANESGFKSRNVIAQKLWTALVFEIWYKRFME